MSEPQREVPDASELLLERDGNGVVTLTLNRPRWKNAIPLSIWEPLRRALHEVSRAPSDRVLVVTGAGGHFCAGAHLTASTPGDQGDQPHELDLMRIVNDAALALHDVPIPTIAKVHGDAVGAGMNLALGCDLVVAGESARFSEIFARRALSLDFGGSWLLPRLVGLHKAKELALFGEILSAREAAEIGVVNRVLPDDELDGFVDAWAKRLAEGAPIALRQSKRMLNQALTVGFAEALDAEAAAQTVNFASQDTREGFVAFVEKRAPVFRGR